MIEITELLDELSKERPIFHSEADFQHALAWKIHEKYSDLNIRLEKRITLNDKEIYIDVFIHKGNNIVAIETKYKTKNINITVSNEEFNLKNHSAPNNNRYDFIKDISRIEECLKKYLNGYAFAIFLTNDSSYWEISRGTDTQDKDFRIHEGRIIKGKLSWKEGASKKTRSEPIILKGKFKLTWKDYSDVKKRNGNFRYLLVKIAHGSGV